MKRSELMRILEHTEDNRMRMLFEYMSISARRITEMIGDGNNLEGLRPKHIVRDDTGQYMARYYILKKDADRKGHEKIRKAFFDKHGNTPQTRSKWVKHLKEKRRSDFEYRLKEKPITKKLLKILLRVMSVYKVERDDRFFPYTYSQCRYRFDKAQKSAGVEYATAPRKTKDKTKEVTLYHMHQLRHYALTQLARKTTNVQQLFQVQDIADHENVDTTQGYVFADKGESRKLMEEAFEEK